jgi:small subunit ribosomal protein S8e
MGISRDKLHKRRATGGRRKVIRGKRKYELGRAPALTKIGEKRIHLLRARGGHYKHRALRLNEGHFVWPGEAATKRSRILNVVYNATSNELVRTNTLVKGCIVQIDGSPFKQWYEQFYRVPLGKPGTKKDEESKKDVKKPVDKPADKKATDKPESAKKDDKAPAKKTPKSAPAKKDDKAPAKKDDKAPAKKDDKAPAKKDDKAPAKKDDKGPKAAATKKDSTPAKKDDKAPAKKKKGDKAAATAPVDTGAPKKPSHHLKRKISSRNKSRVLEQALKDQFNTGRILARISSRPGQSGRADGYILEGEELAFYLKKISKKN